ncbi:uncharacterized protein LOC111325244 [Stylophora pistillata]|uniref:Sorting nexin-19 n=1 Tax=Stylophora pistillata TaxID=50429 RepID=A0A2B4SZ14_STYPI|nr:uncharacterized protein LOC111325244 [Stylophora pistillata]PFX34399.1 Sorting nexin-19 [Stylophora pistillata]
MGWFVVFVVLIGVFFAGLSFKSLCLYFIVTSVSFGLTYLFVTNKWGLDGLFEELFKILELFGFGAPHRLENRIPYSPPFTYGYYHHQDEIPRRLEECFKKLIENIIRDFIRSWYKDVGEGEDFISETRDSLEMLCLEGYRRASQIDSHYMIEQALIVFHGHLERFNKAMAIVKAKDPKLRLNISSSQLLCQTYESQLTSKVPSLLNPSEELSYLRNVIDSLLAAMSPKETYGCDTGRFILREILTVQVVVPLVGLLTDPDRISQAVIDILSDDDDTGRNEVGKPVIRGDQPVMENCDEPRNAVKPQIAEKMPTAPVTENTRPDHAKEKPKKEGMKNIPRKESKESIDDPGERFEIMSPRSEENLDFKWSVSSQRQPPVGESQHDNSESFLIISVEENKEEFSKKDRQSPCEGNWSTEVVPPSSIENLTSCGLSSPWGICPSSQDRSFNTHSFEEIKANLSKVEKFGGIGNSLKELTCCHKFEESGNQTVNYHMSKQQNNGDEERDVSEEELFPKVRTRSLSLPGCDELLEDRPNGKLIRSVSVPSKLAIADFNDPRKYFTPNNPKRFCNPQLYGRSFCSSSDSFKSMSSEEELLDGYVERGEEALECFEEVSYSAGSHWSGARQRITKQASFEESQEKQISNSSPGAFASSKDILPINNDRLRSTKKAVQNQKDISDLADIKESSWEGEVKYHPGHGAIPQKKPLRFGFGGHNTESSFGDAFLTAGKKLVNIMKFDSLSSSSAKSTETSSLSGSESLDYTSGIQSKVAAKEDSLHTATYSSISGRRLSRSDAVIQESIDSDGEACYGTPREEHVQEIGDMNKRGETVDGSDMGMVKRMHPSQLITIPSTIVALETSWEPGRNKYTLYKIEYDIRIWNDVYKAAIKEAKNAAKKEMTKRNLYAGNDNLLEDVEISMDVIKRSVPLKRVINRRYREFMELHNRLTGGNLSVYMKDILKPNRKYNLPFGRLDPHVVEGRRELLQHYLWSLIFKPALRSSEDLKQFLGVMGGEQISFIKPSVAQIVSQSVHVPRVDKMLSRQMTKVFDSIKTAFDSVEEEEKVSEECATASSDDVVIPWKLTCYQDGASGKPEIGYGQESTTTESYFLAFLADCEEFTPPTPPSPIQYKNGDEQGGLHFWKEKLAKKVADFDTEEEASLWNTCQSLGPRTAGDGSDNPDGPIPVHCDLQPALEDRGVSFQRECSEAIFKKHLDSKHLPNNSEAPRSLGLAVNQPAPRSKSMEEIASAPSTSKFQFKPQKILEAFGQGNRSESLENLDTLSTSKEKKPGAFKKCLKDNSIPILSANLKKQKITPVGISAENTLSSKESLLHPEDPCLVSKTDQPNDHDSGSHVERSSVAGSDLQCPLSDTILTLLCELLKEHRSWLTIDRVQQAFMASLGGLFEWKIQSGIDDITTDDSWALYLNKLNEAIWPGGKLLDGLETPKSELEKSKTRKEAVHALMNAFPGFIMLLIGPQVYHQTAVNIIDSVQYPQINKFLVYTLLELLFSEFVPEIQDSLQFFRRVTRE